LKKNTFQALLSHPLFTGEPVARAIQISLYKVNKMYLQECADPVHLHMMDPHFPRFSTTAISRTVPASGGVKPKIKPLLLNTPHFPLPSSPVVSA
jgi:hypothetical protein